MHAQLFFKGPFDRREVQVWPITTSQFGRYRGIADSGQPNALYLRVHGLARAVQQLEEISALTAQARLASAARRQHLPRAPRFDYTRRSLRKPSLDPNPINPRYNDP